LVKKKKGTYFDVAKYPNTTPKLEYDTHVTGEMPGVSRVHPSEMEERVRVSFDITNENYRIRQILRNGEAAGICSRRNPEGVGNGLCPIWLTTKTATGWG
jgi:hypothetical protein